MSRVFTSRRVRWAVPGVVAGAVAVASFGSTVSASASAPKLPARSAAQLLVALHQAQPPMLSGTIVETTHLGLPDIPTSLSGATSGSDSDLSVETFLSGSHTLRVFYGGPDKQRVALLGQTSESDVVHNGTDLWTYSSTTREVTHATLPTPSTKPEAADPSSIAALTPLAEAQKLLAALDPTTLVTVDTTARVAGRAAYQVSLAPKDTHSLIGSVTIALDSATSVPLRVQVFARGATAAALQIGFTDITFGAPDASIFRFTPPAGTTTKTRTIPFVSDTHKAEAKAEHVEHSPDAATLIGSGWTTVAQMQLPGDGRGIWRNSTARTLGKIATQVNGGWIVTSALLTVEITTHSRLLVGPVNATDLEKVETSGQPAP